MVMTLHTLQDIVQHFHGLNDMLTFIQHDRFCLLGHGGICNFCS